MARIITSKIDPGTRSALAQIARESKRSIAQQAAFAVEEYVARRGRISDHQIEAWIERHNLRIDAHDGRAVFEDAFSTIPEIARATTRKKGAK